MEGPPVNPQPAQKVRVPVSELGSRIKSKTEAWHFVCTDMKAYCPPKDVVTAFHLKDMISGRKGYIKGSEITHLSVPHYESLSLDKLLEWANQRHPQVVERMFPIQRELQKFPRQVSMLNLV